MSDQAVDEVAAANPLVATYQGVTGHDHAWPDLSPAGIESFCDVYRSIRVRALSCETPDRRAQLAKDVLVEACDEEIEQFDAGSHHYSLNNIVSAHQELRFVYGSQADETVEDWEAIIERVATIDQPLDGFRQTLEQGRAAGRTVSRRQVETVIEQGDVAGGRMPSRQTG